MYHSFEVLFVLKFNFIKSNFKEKKKQPLARVLPKQKTTIDIINKLLKHSLRYYI